MKEKGHRKELSEMVQETQGAMQFLHRELEGGSVAHKPPFLQIVVCISEMIINFVVHRQQL